MRTALGILVAYVCAMILSLPVTPMVVDGLKARGSLEVVVALLFLGAGACATYVLLVRLKIRRFRYYLMLLGILVALGVIVALVKTHQERVHFLEYGLLAILAGGVFPDPRRAFAFAALLGILDEAIQFLLPMRYFDPRDIAFNAVAAAFGTGVLMLTRRFAPEFHKG